MQLTQVRLRLANALGRLVVVGVSGVSPVDVACHAAPAMQYIVIDFRALKLYGWVHPMVGIPFFLRAAESAERDGGTLCAIQRLVAVYTAALTTGHGRQLSIVVLLVGLDAALQKPGPAARNILALETADLVSIGKVVVLVETEDARLALNVATPQPNTPVCSPGGA